MPGRLLPFSLLFLFVLFISCELDSFLFNEKKIDHYQLPGNTIPDSLLTQVTFKSDGHTLYGYWVRSNGQRPGITLLYCHGNKHNIDEYWDRVMYLHQLGVNVFIFDYRGYGLSEGESSEEGLYRDGESALNYVLSRKEVSRDSLCFYGYSLGNVVSIYLAAEKINPLCLFAEAPFASANSLTQGSTLLDIPPRWLTQGEFDNVEKVRHIKTPFMLLHGEDDELVRYRDNGKVVFENAPEPKLLVLVPGAKHTNVPETMGINRYLETLRDWIDFSVSKTSRYAL
ncbi:MAG: alpha/beta hydrolase [candidate division KSB1 bacterium]|nr:alpha/beta hydrolase [candidate division KSB1 bacterium]